MFKIRLWFYWMVAGVVLIGTIMWLSYWGTQVSQDWVTLQQNPTDASKKKFDASLEIAKAIVAGVGTVATIGGGFFVFWNVQLTQTRLTTERFSKAVEQLGSDKIEVRLGGIYALERIAQDSDRDHWTIMEVLTSFIQEKSSMKRVTEKKIRARANEIERKGSEGTDKQNRDSVLRELESELMTKDIQATLTVIGRRKHKTDPHDKRLDLSDVYLVGAKLIDAKLISADLSSADLDFANLNGADLSHANLNNTELSNASLSHAELNSAELISANLIGADLSHANLNSAELISANLSLANLNSADFSCATLSCADLSGADLSHANFSNAKLCNVSLNNANLSHADLSQTEGLTTEQLEIAKLCQTKFPKGIILDPNRDCKALETEMQDGLELDDLSFRESTEGDFTG